MLKKCPNQGSRGAGCGGIVWVVTKRFSCKQDEMRLADINPSVGGRYEFTNCLIQIVYDIVKEDCK